MGTAVTVSIIYHSLINSVLVVSHSGITIIEESTNLSISSGLLYWITSTSTGTGTSYHVQQSCYWTVPLSRINVTGTGSWIADIITWILDILGCNILYMTHLEVSRSGITIIEESTSLSIFI